ncbi:Insulin-like growth factor-binding protein complex acid labile subunit [Dufourea novaeangliae]|uniref:Insulin-like growth factor-binding protein complex acid labile subunit n=1 Tax=Dufourea novaeangliae TaxID=178035 RepID=A0A154P063_DUFNO|nr:Insulin-like growth factor-binding protein complex acid labile subunit [Dufourea novaeangliae]
MEKRVHYSSLLQLLAVLLGISSLAICQSVCPARCSCHFSKQPRTVICSRQSLEEVPENISDVVEQLNLSNNLLTHITSDINRLTDLQYLNLARNMLSSLPDDISDLKNLRRLDLTGNAVHEIVDISSVKQLPSLVILYLSRNPLYNLEGLISPSLEALDASHCEIRELSNTSLDGLPALTTLSLVGNPLKFIQKAWSPKLRWLDMSDCLLNYLSPDTFSGFPELEELRLSNNPTLVYSTRNSTLSHPNLKKLDVSKCNLDRPGLHGFPSLTHARLSRNAIGLLPDYIFTKNRELGFLYLNTNDVESLNASTFEGLVKLQVLDLSANNLREIHPLAFRENMDLKMLNLSYNILYEFPNLTSAVTLLDVSSNLIKELNVNFLRNMPKIRSIILSDNRLETISSGIKSTSLKNLDLRRNRLVGLENDTFLRLPQLLRLDLSGNRLTEAIDPAIFRNNPDLNSIKLEDNPWRCDCRDLYVLFNYLTEPPAKATESNLLCQSPANVTGYSWEIACFDTWNASVYYNRDRTWGFIMITVLTIIVLFGSFVSIRHMMRVKRRAMEQRQQLESLTLLRQRRLRTVHEEERREHVVERAPEPRINPLELIGPPSYEEAVQMPRLTHSLDHLDEISVETSTMRIMGSADNLRTKQRRTRRVKTRILSEDDLLRREERRQEAASQRNSRANAARRARRQSMVSDSVDSGSGRLRARPQTPSAKSKKRRYTVYDGHLTDDEDSDIQQVNLSRSMVIRELRTEPKSGYRETTVDIDS